MRNRLIAVVFFGVLPMAVPCAGVNAQDVKGKPNFSRLIKDLTDPNERVSEGAVDALGKTGIDAIEELLKAFEKGDAKTRPMVAHVLGKLRLAAIKAKEIEMAESIEKILLEALRDPNDMVVNKASNALTAKEPRSTKAVPIFIEILIDDDKTHLARAAACGGLTELGPAAADSIPVLLDCLKNKVGRQPDIKGKSPEEVYLAYQNSKHYVDGERSALCYVSVAVGPNDERVMMALTACLRNRKEEEAVRIVAALLLSEIKGAGQAIVSDLVQILKETTDKKKKTDPNSIRWAAVASLAKLKIGKREAAVLLDIAVDKEEKNFEVRAAAAEALGNSPSISQAAWGPLLELLQNGECLERGLCVKAVIALGRIPPPADTSRADLVRELRTTFDMVLDLK
jgi:HEAT repeat protein